jgi:hypothetical protein
MMLTLAEIRDWLKTLDNKAENYYIGKIDNKKEKSIGVYQLNLKRPNRVCIGGLDNTKTASKSVSILFHYNKNAAETEQFALSFFNELNELSRVREIQIGSKIASFVELLNSEPVDVGTDDNGVYERVIEATIYYDL